MSSAIKPHGLFSVWSPDAVAECLDGVDLELSRRLWQAANAQAPDRSEVPDNFEQNCLASVWDQFSESDQQELNRLAEEEERRLGVAMERIANGL